MSLIIWPYFCSWETWNISKTFDVFLQTPFRDSLRISSTTLLPTDKHVLSRKEVSIRRHFGPNALSQSLQSTLFLSLWSKVWWVQASTISKILQGKNTTRIHPLLLRLFNLSELLNTKCQLCQGQEFSAWVQSCIAPRWELLWVPVHHASRGQKLVMGVFLNHPLPYILRQNFSWTWSSLIQLDRADREGQHLP